MSGKSQHSNLKSSFAEIFHTFPQLQNEFSSMWFFFVLFPKQNDTYGPKQLMFSFASKVGKSYGVGGKWQNGMKLSKNDTKIRKFMTTAVGWCFDGEQMHEDLVHQDVLASVSKDGWVKGWKKHPSGEKYGGEIIASELDESKLKVFFNGKDGFGKFDVWGEDDWEMSQPVSYNNVSRFFSNLLVAWRKFSFKGNFGYDNKVDEMEGYGYFQRVCVNLPTVPWFWPILVFPNGSIFSSFQPYFGSNSFKKTNRITNSALSKIRFNISSTAYYANVEKKEIIHFKESYVREFSKDENEIGFEIVSRNQDTGDYIHIITKSLAETGWNLEKRMFGIFHSLWNYNEHVVKITKIKGMIAGKKLVNTGNIYGNTEYAWGMSI